MHAECCLYCGASVPLFSHYCLRYVLRFQRGPTVSARAHQCPSAHQWESKTVSSAAVDLTLASEGHKPVVGIQRLRLATPANSAAYAMSEAILLVATSRAHRGAKVAARCSNIKLGKGHKVMNINLSAFQTSVSSPVKKLVLRGIQWIIKPI